MAHYSYCPVCKKRLKMDKIEIELSKGNLITLYECPICKEKRNKNLEHESNNMGIV